MSVLNQCLFEQHTLQCMEIWGGSHAAETNVSTPGLELWLSSRPYEHGTEGGDVHYVSLCGGGIITRFILADVAGHGEAVAEVARSLRALMRKNINRKKQTRLVGELNRQFSALSQAGRFATALVATYLATTRQLTVSNAGHPYPFLYRAASGEWSVLSGRTESAQAEAANLPFGIDEQGAYDQTIVALDAGDFLLFYTDGLVEMLNAQGRPLGESGLLELVRGLDLNRPRDAAQGLLSGLDEFRGNREAGDDQTFLLLRHSPGPPRHISLREKLDIYAKVFGLKAV